MMFNVCFICAHWCCWKKEWLGYMVREDMRGDDCLSSFWLSIHILRIMCVLKTHYNSLRSECVCLNTKSFIFPFAFGLIGHVSIFVGPPYSLPTSPSLPLPPLNLTLIEDNEYKLYCSPPSLHLCSSVGHMDCPNVSTDMSCV